MYTRGKGGIYVNSTDWFDCKISQILFILIWSCSIYLLFWGKKLLLYLLVSALYDLQPLPEGNSLNWWFLG